MRIGRLCSLGAALALVASGVVGLSVAPAHAEDSTTVYNDTIATAAELTQLPFYQLFLTTADTTTDDLERSYLPSCEGSMVIENGIWFHTIAPANGTLQADVSLSGFNASVVVLKGTAASPEFVSCNAYGSSTAVTAGDSIYFLAYGNGTNRSPTAGPLVFELHFDPASSPPPTVTQRVLSIGTVARDGSVTVGGTVTCSDGDSVSTILGSVEQKRRHRSTVTGDLEATPGQPCDGKPHFWKATVTGLDGKRFQVGFVRITVEAVACGAGGCTPGDATRTALVLPAVKWWSPWRGRPA